MTVPRLVVLAGGSGSRMGGDKLRLRDATGRLLILRWFDRLGRTDPPLLVLPPGGAVPDELADWPRVHDTTAGDGPLRGVETALASTGDEWVMVVAVDTPGVGREQLDWLADRRAADPAARLWMARRGDAVEPLPMLIHRAMRSAVGRRLAESRRSLHGLVDEPHARAADTPHWPAAVWRNLNRPADLADYLASEV